MECKRTHIILVQIFVWQFSEEVVCLDYTFYASGASARAKREPHRLT